MPLRSLRASASLVSFFLAGASLPPSPARRTSNKIPRSSYAAAKARARNRRASAKLVAISARLNNRWPGGNGCSTGLFLDLRHCATASTRCPMYTQLTRSTGSAWLWWASHTRVPVSSDQRANVQAALKRHGITSSGLQTTEFADQGMPVHNK